MLFLPESHLDELRELSARLMAEGLSPAAAAPQLLERDPGFAAAYVALGAAALDEGNLADAERFYWKALELEPFGTLPYQGLARLYRKWFGDGGAADFLSCLGLYTAGLSEEVPMPLVEAMKAGSDDPDFDPEDPESYLQLAELQESKLTPDAVPDELGRRIRPYRLLIEFARGVNEGLSPHELNPVREEPACLPVMHAALRSWAREPEATNYITLLLIVALLGEHGDPELLPDLWDLSTLRDDQLFLHAHWALCRMAQREPSAMIASIHANLPSAPTSLRCGMAEHLSLMRGAPGATDAILALMQDFASRAHDDDAPYLLLACANALAETGQVARSKQLFAQYERQLTKEGRRSLRDLTESDEGFVPRIVAENLHDFDIEEVCLNQVLMGPENEDDPFDDEDDWEEEDFEEDDLPPAVTPGRNEPCWCGSGKKYKKCHLEADEKQAREESEGGTEEDPVRSEAFAGLLDTADRFNKRDMIEAARQYFGDSMGEDEPPEGTEGFLMWYLLDYRASNGRTAAEEHLRKNGARLNPDVRAFVEAWRDSRVGLFSVEKTGAEFELKDLYAGDTLRVPSFDVAAEIAPGDQVLARIETLGGNPAFAEEPLPISMAASWKMQQLLEKDASGRSPSAVLRAHIPELRRILRDE